MGESYTCLFFGLSVGQGLCCCLPCSRLEHPPPGEPGILGQRNLVLALQPAGSLLTASGFCCIPRGFVDCLGVPVLWSFVSAGMGQSVFWCCWHSRRKVDCGRGRAVVVLPSLCVVTPNKNPHIVLADCKLGFHIDLGWWDIRLEILGC